MHGRTALLLAAIGVLLGVVGACDARDSVTTAQVLGLHYAANSNISASGSYVPGRLGFNLADIGSKDELDGLPKGVKGLVYLGLCHGADVSFRTQVSPYAGDPKLFGFYLLDEPDPTSCAATSLAAESAYIHAHIRGARTFLLVQNLASSRTPTFRQGYTRANTGIDLFGIDPYPCRSELGRCDFGMIERYVRAAERDGIPAATIVPVFQTFGGGQWVDDGDGRYVLPTPSQATRLLQTWQQLIPHPVFDFVYSWGVQRNDRTLGVASAALQHVFTAHNHGSTSR